MAKLFWYVNRLRMMSASEIIWRLRMLAADTLESIAVTFGYAPSPSSTVWPKDTECFFTPEPNADFSEQWQQQLVQSADKISARKLSFFSHQDLFIGRPARWRMDHLAGIEGPLNLIQFVDYRDQKKFGDCKEVWEPNRHHHLVVLARAYYITGEKKYADATVQEIEDWIEGNPYGRGMNWRSPLELGIRLINWVWAIALIEGSDSVTERHKSMILAAVYQQCRDITRKFSQGSSANNHLIGEAAGVFIAACYFNEFKESSEWRAASQTILEQEIFNQTYDDGCTREHALGYQLFVIQFFVASGLVGRWYQSDFSTEYWQRLQRMFGFVSAVSAAGGSLPFFGDRDDGYVLDLGNACSDTDMLTDLSARLFEGASPNSSETGYWLLPERPAAATSDRANLQSISHPDSGYHLLQATTGNRDVSIFIDTADLGYQSIAAHGHADALAITMRLAGQDVFVDSGTYDYFSYPAWRNYFRSTRAHNTVEIDGLDQSQMQGAFMWDQHAECALLDWSDTDTSTRLSASHNGYERLTDPVGHKRTLNLDKAGKKLMISDRLDGKTSHQFAAHFHCHPSVEIKLLSDFEALLDVGGEQMTFKSEDPIKLISGDPKAEEPDIGWFSVGYHQKTTTNVIRIQGDFEGTKTLTFELSWT